MANTLSSLGGSIFVDGYDGERMVTLIADANVKAGWLVGQDSGDGIAIGVNATGNVDEMDGIMAEHYKTDLDSAPGAGKFVTVVYPISGHRYRVAIYSAGALYAGEPMVVNTGHAGMMEGGGDIEAAHQARLSKNVTAADNFAEVVWGA